MVKSETLLLLILILFDTQSDTKISHLLIHSPNTHSAWAVPNSRNVILVSHMDDRDPRTSVTPLFLLRYTLAGSWNWEQILDLNTGILTREAGFLTAMPSGCPYFQKSSTVFTWVPAWNARNTKMSMVQCQPRWSSSSVGGPKMKTHDDLCAIAAWKRRLRPKLNLPAFEQQQQETLP